MDQPTENQSANSPPPTQPQPYSPAQLALLNQLNSAQPTPVLLEPDEPNLSDATIISIVPAPAPFTPSPGIANTADPLDFARPSSYLRSRSSTLGASLHTTAMAGAQGGASSIATEKQPEQHQTEESHSAPNPQRMSQNLGQIDMEQRLGLKRVRQLLRKRTGYDVLPISYRLIVLDTSLLVKASLNVLTQNAIVSAPLWNSKNSTFAGLITANDYINVVQYYWHNPNALAQIGQFRLDALPDIEKSIGATPVETISIHPERPLYEACKLMLESRARRIPLVDIDDETQRAMVVSVITQYRILKFITVNTQEILMLGKPLKDLNIGTFGTLSTASMDTPVIDAIHMLVKKSISSIPIVDSDGMLLNVFEAVDVITLIKGGNYDELNQSIGEAILKRSEDFEGIHTCSMHDCLATILDTVRKSRVHRFVVIDNQGKLTGMLTLSDILHYLLTDGATADDEP